MLSLSLSGALALIALAYSLLLGFKLLTQSSSDTIANTLLGVFCFSMAVWSWSTLARDVGLYLRAPHLLYVATPLFYVLGPALFMYTKRITLGVDPLSNRRQLIHLAPFSLFIIAAVPFYRLSALEKLHIYEGSKATNTSLGVMLALMAPHMLIYTLMCLKPIRRYEAQAKDHFSDLEYGNLRWLKRLCIGMLILVLLDFLMPTLSKVLTWNTRLVDPAAVMRMCLLLYTVFLGFSALGQPPFRYKAALPENELPIPSMDETELSFQPEENSQLQKYARSGLRNDSAQYYVEKLRALMCDQKAFLDCDLTLRSLAVMLRLRPHHLSQILNEQVGKSFYDYINEHRVAHAKGLLADNGSAAMSILDVAFASGYNNKVSFYNAFKKYVGMTPTRYREEQGTTSSPHRQQ